MSKGFSTACYQTNHLEYAVELLPLEITPVPTRRKAQHPGVLNVGGELLAAGQQPVRISAKASSAIMVESSVVAVAGRPPLGFSRF